jgi:hypothetical protein
MRPPAGERAWPPACRPAGRKILQLFRETSAGSLKWRAARRTREIDHMAKRSEIEAALRRLAPRIPSHEFAAIADHGVDSTGLRTAAPETAAWLSLVAYVRHALTDYDDLLAQGYDAESARHFVAGEIDAVLHAWGCGRRVSGAN